MIEKKKRATPWKSGKVISIRLRNGVYVLAQMVREPYLVFFNHLGMDMTTAINIFLRQAIQYQGLPFDVKIDENRKLLQVVTDVEQNRNMSQSFESVSDLMEDLRA